MQRLMALREGESRGEQGGVVEEPDEVLDGLVRLVGLISMVFLELMYPDMELSRRACAFMMRSMLAVQPYSPVTRQHGDSTMRLETMTFSTLSSRTSFMSLQRPSDLAFSSSKASSPPQSPRA